MQLRTLGPEHRPQFSEFECARYREPWTLAVQESIRENLADALGQEHTHGLGLWDDDVLVGIVVWAVDPDDPGIWTSNIVAVRHGRFRRHHGLRLKQELIARARAAGARVIVSIIHRDNTAMIEFNQRKFDAQFARDPESFENLICTIVLR